MREQERAEAVDEEGKVSKTIVFDYFELIIETFNIKPSKTVGDIKNAIKEAILEGEIHNNYNEAYHFMIKIGESLGLTPKK